MKLIRQSSEISKLIGRLKRKGSIIGFVPTMGALHEGHLSLIRAARRENDVVIVSIFVNPIQFNRKTDLDSYPRTIRKDSFLTRQAGVDFLFVPAVSEIYPMGFQTTVEVGKLSRLLEGHRRPGHYRGVTTIVAKFFHIVQPDTVYFGQKDAQQARIIQQMVKDLSFGVKVKVMPTIREKDGLAMSSRNQLLSSKARRSSRIIFEALQEASRLIRWKERRADVILRRMRQSIHNVHGIRIDYIALVDPETFEDVKMIRKKARALVAVWSGSVRLIDEMLISVR